MSESLRRDLDLCNEHRELADLLIEHGCAPAGEDRALFRALIEREVQSCIDSGGHFWPDDAPEDVPPTCTRCGYNPGWLAGKDVNECAMPETLPAAE